MLKGKRPKRPPIMQEPLPPRQEFKAIVVLPEGLTPAQIEELKRAFETSLIATLGGPEFLADRNIRLVLTDIIERPVIIS